MYSRTRLLTDLTKLKEDAREMIKHTEGTALPITNGLLKMIVLDLDEVIAKERKRSDNRQFVTLNN